MRIFISLICLSLTSNASAIDYIKKNHINVGINTFYRDYREIIPHENIESGVLAGIILGYEHKAPSSILFTADLNLSVGNTHYDGGLQYISNDYAFPSEFKVLNLFLNLDTQIGYTFSKCNRHLFTPFVGLGVSRWDSGLDNFDEKYKWSYWSGGFQYDYNANSKYQYGLHLKVMKIMPTTMQIPELSSKLIPLSRKRHLEVSTPLIYKPNPIGKNYWRFTPYYQYQRFGESDIVPLQSELYFFTYIRKPNSRAHIVGIKAEHAFGF